MARKFTLQFPPTSFVGGDTNVPAYVQHASTTGRIALAFDGGQTEGTITVPWVMPDTYVSGNMTLKLYFYTTTGDAPDGDLVSLAGLRSKHNTYMSFPLLWTMINQHHAAGVLSGGNFGVTDATNWVPLMVMVALGWHVVWQLYKKSAKVQGM